jgi:putative membrane protein
MMWNGAMSGWGWLMMALWIVFIIAMLVLLGLAIVWLARNVASGSSQRTGRQARPGMDGSAREVLDLRYARGEIDRDQYVRARQDLEGTNS